MATRAKTGIGTVARRHPQDRLGRLAIFRGADPALLAAAERHAAWMSAAPGECVIDYGEATKDVFALVEGSVRVLVLTPLGQEMILGDLGPGEIFGDMAAIDDVPRSASVIALRTTRLCRLPAASFLSIALHSAAVAQRVMRALTSRLRLQEERHFDRTVLPARERLIAELLRLSRPLDGSQERVISQPPSQQMLATRIGSRRETVSLAMAALGRAGLVASSQQSLLLPQPEALREMIDRHLRALRATAPPHAGPAEEVARAGTVGRQGRAGTR